MYDLAVGSPPNGAAYAQRLAQDGWRDTITEEPPEDIMNKKQEKTKRYTEKLTSTLKHGIEHIGSRMCNLGYNLIHLQSHRDRHDPGNHYGHHKSWGMRGAEVVLALAVGSEAIGAELNVPERDTEYAPGHFIATYEPWANQAVRENLNRSHGTETVYESPYGFSLVKVPEGQSAESFSLAYSHSQGVRSATLDYKATAFGPATDAYLQNQWNLDRIRAQQAWQITTGDVAVKVAILDTGVHPAAEDLSSTSFAAGWDFVDQDDQPTDLNGHGTHIAGIIAQSTNNGIGTAGIAYSTTIMPIKVLDDTGSGYTSRIIEGIYYAAHHQADVINMSFGYPATLRDPGLPLHGAIRYANAKGITLVAAAGNQGFKNAVSYPAAYPEVIGVGATRFDNQVTSYSNKGVEVELVAPGGDLSVDQNGDGFPDGILQESLSERTFGYYYAQGTSMAAAHVSAVAALLIALKVDSPLRVRNILRDTARDLGKPGYDKQSGYGLIDARRAAEAACRLASRCNG